MAAVATLSILLYLRALGFAFFNDDPGHLRWTANSSILLFFTHSGDYGYYRPFTFTVFKLLLGLFGSYYAPGFHALLLVLHAANAALLWLAALRISGRQSYAWLAALAFATFPLSYEAVAYVGALFHPLLTFLALVTVLLYDRARRSSARRYLFAAHLSLAVALFTHEAGVMVPLLLLVWEWLTQPSPSLRNLIASPVRQFFIAPALFGTIWIAVPKSGDHGLRGIADILRSIPPFLQAVAYPLLPFVHLTPGKVALLATVAIIVLGGTYIIARFARARRLWAFALAWVVFTALPSLLFLDPLYVSGSPRLYYLPSVGVALLWGLALLALGESAVRTPARRHLVLGLQAALFLAIVLPPLAYIRCELDLFTYVTQVVQSMRDGVVATPAGRETAFINLPFYIPSHLDYPVACVKPYPFVQSGVVIIPEYADVRDFVAINGGPDRPVLSYSFPGYGPAWPTHGDNLSPDRLRLLVQNAQVYVFDLASGPLLNLSGAGRLEPVPATSETTAAARFLAPLYALPETAQPSDVASATPAGIIFGDALELAAYRLEPDAVLPGQVVSLTLFWRATGQPVADVWLNVRLRDHFGNVLAEDSFWPPPSLSAGRWDVGTTYGTRWQLSIPPNAAMGRSPLGVSVRRQADGTLLPARSFGQEEQGSAPQVASLLIGQASVAEAGELGASQPVQAKLGSAIALMGYRLASDRVQAGGIADLTLYWQAEQPITQSFTVFVHIVDGEGKVVAQQDNEPNGGRYPTSAWVVAKTIRDSYSVQLPADLPPGRYLISIGMYEWPSLQRLAVTQADEGQDDTIRLGYLYVER